MATFSHAGTGSRTGQHALAAGDVPMRRLAWLATLPLLVLPLTILAADGYTTGNVNLRAGPDTSYPRLDTLPAGAPVDIQGCTSGWEWCDVVFQGERGWVAGNFIQY
ncbi:MAG: hypothetical protein EPN68_14945, partial [Rhodanobacter sp.]